MPFYEFKCSACGFRFEKMCSMGDKGENLLCPECGAIKPQRVFSTFSSPGGDSGSAGGNSKCSGCSSGNCSSCH
jgi:putative FmdB family regulatory protein